MKYLFLKYLLKDCLVNIEKNDVMHGYKYNNNSFDNTDISLCLFSDAAPCIGNNLDFNKWFDDMINTTTDNFNNKLFVAIFDLPARAKAVNMISHTGYFACINCEIEGIYDFNKVWYPFKKKLVLRDKIKYNLCLKEVEYKKSKSSLIKQGECNFNGIKGSTVLTENLDILQDVVYDYMHLCCEEGT